MADNGSSVTGGGGSSHAVGDYSHLGWKDVMRYVTGADPDHPENDPTASLISDPQTIQDAADAFWYTQTLLQDAAQSLSDQTEALTGASGPWQGEAAQALGAAMKSLSQQVSDMADSLSGGITGDNNVPQQLADNAEHLRGAISKLHDIDSWYAKQALKIDPTIVMSNGLVAVGQVKSIPPMLDNDMRQVLVTLAGHYAVTTDSVTPPPTLRSPVATGPGTTGTTGPGGSGNLYRVAYNPYPGGSTGGGGGNLPSFSPSGSGTAAPYPGGTAGGGGGNLPSFSPSGSGTAAPYPGDTTGGGGGNLPDFGGASPATAASYPGGGGGAGNGVLPGFSGSGLPVNGVASPSRSPAPQPYSGNSSLDGTGNLPGNGAFIPNLATVNSQVPGSTAESPGSAIPYPGLGLSTATSNPTGDYAKSPAQYPGSTGSLNSPGGINLAGPSGSSPADLPGVNTSGIAPPNLAAPIQAYPDSALASEPVNGTVGSSGSTGSSMPMMPMGGGGGAGAARADVPSSDASGLLQGSATPWQGSTSLGGSGQLPGGTRQGGPGLDLPGLPTTAQGLTAGNPQPWQGSTSLDGFGALPAGAPPGTPDTLLPGAQTSPSGLAGLDGMGSGSGQSAQGSGQSASGMPMMPMGGGGGAGAARADVPSSDASGLLQGSATPWQGSTSPGGSGRVPGGTAPGGPGLHLPDGQSSPRGLSGLDHFSGLAGPEGSGSGSGTSAQVSGENADATPVMPMMPMGAGPGNSGGEQPASDASGLLEGRREPWADTPVQHGADAGSAPGAQPDAGPLWLLGGSGDAGTGHTGSVDGGGNSGSPSGARFGTAGVPDTESPGRDGTAGLLDGLPFLAAGMWAAGAAASGSGQGTRGGFAEPGEGRPDAQNTGLAASAPVQAGAEPAGPAPQEPDETVGAPGALPQEPAGTAAPSESVGQVAETAEAVSAAAPAKPQVQAAPEPTPEAGQDAAGQTSGAAVGAGEGTVQEATGTTTPVRPTVVPVDGPVAGSVGEPSVRVSAQTPVGRSAPRSAHASAVEVPAVAATGSAGATGSMGATSTVGPARATDVTGIAGTPSDVGAARTSDAARSADAVRASDTAARPVVPVAASEGTAADDMSAWDAPDGSLRHLLGEPSVGAAVGNAADALTRDQETAALTGLTGAAYGVGRQAGTAGAQAFDEPVRPAWKPKAPGAGAPRRMEFTCAGGPEATPAAEKSDESQASSTRSKGRTRRKDKEDDESTSVGDLLRQSEEVWGAGPRPTGSRG
jgi:hypothetical protein